MKIYNSIDTLNLFCYSKIIETEDLRYLIIQSDYYELPTITDKEYAELFKVWEKINDEIIDYTGISDEYKSIMRVKKSIALLKLEIIITGDKSIENIIELKQLELGNMLPKQKQSIDEIIISIEDIKKREINIFTTSVKKYLTLIKSIQNKNG